MYDHTLHRWRKHFCRYCYDRKIKPPFIIYADFYSILVPEDNGKQNLAESYTNKYQKYVACSYGDKLVCADDKCSKLLKSYLGENAAYNFIDGMIEESKFFDWHYEKIF